MPVIFIQLDALRHDYISEQHTPFLYSLKQEKSISGVLKPTYGFEPDAAYIAGLYPDEADGGAQYWYEPEVSPFKIFKYFPINYFPGKLDWFIRRIYERLYKKKAVSPVFSTAKIPFKLLKYFNFPMQHKMAHPDFVESDTIFDALRKNGLNWITHAFPDNKVNMKAVLARVENETEKDFDFAFFHIGDLDAVGHQYGPESSELKNKLSWVDSQLKKMYQIINERFSDVNWILIGDHGMMQIKHHFNLMGLLDSLGLQLEKDYLVFIDSTQARFWFYNDKARTQISRALSSVKNGRILNPDELNKYHLNYAHNKFGELFFVVNPGVLIFPNFYQIKNPVQGMHGYPPETPEQQSAFIFHLPHNQKQKHAQTLLDMRMIYPVILKLLGLPIQDRFKKEPILEYILPQ